MSSYLFLIRFSKMWFFFNSKGMNKIKGTLNRCFNPYLRISTTTTKTLIYTERPFTKPIKNQDTRGTWKITSIQEKEYTSNTNKYRITYIIGRGSSNHISRVAMPMIEGTAPKRNFNLNKKMWFSSSCT